MKNAESLTLETRSDFLFSLREARLEVDAVQKNFENEQHLRLVTDTLPAFVSYMDLERRYRFVNQVYCDWFGRPSSEIEGHTRAEIFGKSVYDFVAPYEDAAYAGNRVAFELTLKKASGEYVNLDVEYLPLIDRETKKIRGIIGIGQNVSARKKALQESELAKQRLHSLFLQAPVAIAVMEGQDLRFTLVNQPYEKLASRTDLIGKNFREEWPELEAQGIFKILERVLASGESFQGTEYPIRLNPNDLSQIRYFDLSFVATRNVNDQVDGAMSIITEVTDQVEAKRKAQETQQRYRSLTDFLPNMMWTADREGRVNYANNRCLQYTGISTQEKFGELWNDVIHQEDTAKVRESWAQSVSTGKTFNLEYRIRRYDGEYRWFLGRAIAITNVHGDILYWIGTATDIDDGKRTAVELVAAKNAAENANRTKTAFLANMSHEIRTPLGAMLGFSELLKDPALGGEDRDYYVETIARNGRALTRIIDDILDIAKVEAGRLEIEEIAFSFSGLLAEIVELFRDSSKQKNIEINLRIDKDVPNWILSDPTRLRQILINVVGNAVKFTEKGSVDIRVRALEESAKNIWFSIEVKDTGRGIAPAQRNRLFKAFTQADNSTTRRYGGTGLGLVLSRRLAEALGGTVVLSEEPQEIGATFTVSFIAGRPEREPQVSTKVAEAAPMLVKKNQNEKPLQESSILLVDDSLDNQFLVKHLLVKLGAKVDLANNGVEAVEIVKSKTYDVVLMDIQMPEMDGYQANAILQSMGYKSPVVALTAHALVEERMKTKAAGFAAHLTKPIDKDELVTIILSCQNKSKSDLSHA